MKKYEDILMEILFFPTEDIICASISIDEDKDNAGDMPDLPFLPNA